MKETDTLSRDVLVRKWEEVLVRKEQPRPRATGGLEDVEFTSAGAEEVMRPSVKSGSVSRSIVSELRSENQPIHIFVESQPGNVVNVWDQWLVRGESTLDIVAGLADLVKGEYKGYYNARYFIEWEGGIIHVDPNHAGRATDVVKSSLVPITIVTDKATAEGVLAYLDKKYTRYKKVKNLSAKWWYLNSNGQPQATDIIIDEPNKIRQEYYPWLPSMNEFFKDYLEGKTPILLMSGPPGTGKTTLLRSMLYDNNLSAAVAYDEDLLKNDQMFIDFMTSDSQQVLIIEDADTLVTSREHHGNKLIARFLNVADGIIQFPKKKIIFTSNLRDFNDVDHALIRPGRCYATLNARELTLNEAQVVAGLLSNDEPTEERPYSLAELFNKKHVAQLKPRRRVGFGV